MPEKPTKPCTRCGEPRARERTDPYQKAINNVKVRTVLCDECYGNLCDAI